MNARTGRPPAHTQDCEETMQKRSTWHRRITAGAALLWSLMLMAACHDGGDDHHHHKPAPPPLFETQIVSDPRVDGDIGFSFPDTYTITSASTTGSVLAGIDPLSGDEFRGFFHFELGGPDGVPSGAAIDAATLSVFVTSVAEPFAGAKVFLLVDLISFQPPELIFEDFDRDLQPPLLTLRIEITAADAGRFVNIDVTPLMQRAQRLELPDFQIRLVFDGPFASGLVEFEDSALDTAPLLIVRYY
jgi:hypothetical protein